MADIPSGPGQSEVIGPIKDPQAPNQPGLYRDPQSQAELVVSHPAGADALVRMGWVLETHLADLPKSQQPAASPSRQPLEQPGQPVEAPAPAEEQAEPAEPVEQVETEALEASTEAEQAPAALSAPEAPAPEAESASEDASEPAEEANSKNNNQKSK